MKPNNKRNNTLENQMILNYFQIIKNFINKSFKRNLLKILKFVKMTKNIFLMNNNNEQKIQSQMIIVFKGKA